MLTDIKHFHIFCGAGGGALGFQRGQAKVGPLQARFVCLGGIDNDAPACRDFARLVGTPATCLDLFSAEQYAAFHGRRPGPSWREACADDLRCAAQGQRPDILFFSAPCKGFSGLLSSERSASPKYEALNGLALRGLMLALEAWGDDPPALVLFENVPRIAQRGRRLLDQIMGLLRAHGYAARETTHDAGEIGGLAQHRRRFLLVARHEAKVPSFLYEPARRRVRSIGEELAALPPPGAAAAGPMHALPQLTWPTWVRLALIPAGKDWRALKGLDLSKFGLLRYGDHAGKMRVEPWEGPSHTVTGSDRVGSGALSVADVRWGEYGQYGVLSLDRPSGAVTAQAAPGSGSFSIADPSWGGGRLGVLSPDEPSGAVTGEAYPSNGRFSLADPGWRSGVMGVLPLDSPAGTVAGRSGPTNGAYSCPKNTASQRMLFGESKDDDAACLDAACWRSKVDAACAAAVKAGAQLLEGPEAAKLITSYGELDYKSKLKPLSSSCYVGYSADQSETEDDGPSDEPRDRRPTHRTYGDLLKPALDARPDELVLVRNPKNPGQVFQCVREERLPDLLKESGQAALAASQEKQQKRQEKSPSQQKQEQKAKAEDLARREAMGRMGSFVEEELGKGWSHPGYCFGDLESFLREVVSLVWTKKGSLAAKRRGLGEDGAPDDSFDTKKVKADPRLADLPMAALVGFLVELVVEERAGGMYPSPRALRVFRQIPGLDLDALIKQHLQQLRAGKPTAKKKRS